MGWETPMAQRVVRISFLSPDCFLRPESPFSDLPTINKNSSHRAKATLSVSPASIGRYDKFTNFKCCWFHLTVWKPETYCDGAHNEISADPVGLDPGPCFPTLKSAELWVLLTLLLIDLIYLKIYKVQFIYLFGVFCLFWGFVYFLVSCRSGWPWTLYLARLDLSWSSCLCPPSAGIAEENLSAQLGF